MKMNYAEYAAFIETEIGKIKNSIDEAKVHIKENHFYYPMIEKLYYQQILLFNDYWNVVRHLRFNKPTFFPVSRLRKVHHEILSYCQYLNQFYYEFFNLKNVIPLKEQNFKHSKKSCLPADVRFRVFKEESCNYGEFLILEPKLQAKKNH